MSITLALTLNKEHRDIELLEQNDEIDGRRLQDWLGEWWNWTLSNRINANQTGEVYFLRINPKPSESDSALRAEFCSSAVVFDSQVILFPTLNTMIDNGSFPSEDTHTKRINTAKNENSASPIGRMRVTIDGEDLIEGNPNRIRMSSRQFELEATETPLVRMDFPIPEGTWSAATDGFWLAIRGLPVRDNPYILRINSEGLGGYIVNIVYRIQVVKKDDFDALFDYQLLPKINEMVGSREIKKSDAEIMLPRARKSILSLEKNADKSKS